MGNDGYKRTLESFNFSFAREVTKYGYCTHIFSSIVDLCCAHRECFSSPFDSKPYRLRIMFHHGVEQTAAFWGKFGMIKEFTKVLVNDELERKIEHTSHGRICQSGSPLFIKDNHTISNGIQNCPTSSRFDSFPVK